MKIFLTILAGLIGITWAARVPAAGPSVARPNILIALSDDQTWLHTSAAGSTMVKTPATDRVIKMGVRYNNCMGGPICSPTRACLLTGLQPWMLKEAGTHSSSFPKEFVTYPDLLEAAGYFVGFTGKGWGPGDWKISGRTRNPAGPDFDNHRLVPPTTGISKVDYAANFADFLAARPKDKPFCFWYGAHEPHRDYEKDSGLKFGKKLADAEVPPFLPDTPEIRSDLLDYATEIEWYDTHLARIMKMIEDAGELDNTMIIASSDNGMPFPRAKANLYEYGIHEPLAICWPKRVPGGRVIDDVVGFVDLTATILEAAEVSHPATTEDKMPVGHSLLDVLESDRQGITGTRQEAYSGRERTSSARYQNLGYPARCLRNQQYLYIRNFRPERLPAGDPQFFVSPGKLSAPHAGYFEIDHGPTLTFMTEHLDDPKIAKFFHLAIDKRGKEELFDIQKDPGCLDDLAGKPDFAATLARMRDRLEKYLIKTGDSRLGKDPEIWETYKRNGGNREFPAAAAGKRIDIDDLPAESVDFPPPPAK